MIRTGAEALTVSGVFEPEGDGWRGVLEEAGLEAEGDEVLVRREIGRSGTEPRLRQRSADDAAAARRPRPLAAAHPRPARRAGADRARPAARPARPERRRRGRAAPRPRGRGLRRATPASPSGWSASPATTGCAASGSTCCASRPGRSTPPGSGPGETRSCAPSATSCATPRPSPARSAPRLALLFEEEGSAVERVGKARTSSPRWRPGSRRPSAWRAELEEVRIRLAELARALQHRLDGLDADPARLDAVEERLAMVERLCRKHGGDRPRSSPGAPRSRPSSPSWRGTPQNRDELESEGRRGARRSTARRRSPCRRPARRGARPWSSGSRASSRTWGSPAPGSRWRWSAGAAPAAPCRRRRGDRLRPRRRRPGRLPLRAQPGRGAAAAGPDRLGRRAVAHLPRPAARHPRRGREGAPDAGLRRGRHRHRRRRGRGAGRQAPAPRQGRPDPRRHPPAAGGEPRRPPLQGQQAGRRRTHQRPGGGAGRRSPGSRRWPACWPGQEGHGALALPRPGADLRGGAEEKGGYTFLARGGEPPRPHPWPLSHSLPPDRERGSDESTILPSSERPGSQGPPSPGGREGDGRGTEGEGSRWRISRDGDEPHEDPLWHREIPFPATSSAAAASSPSRPNRATGWAPIPGTRTGVEAIYRIKGREAGKPLPVVVAGPGAARGFGSRSQTFIYWKCLSARWPAPLTAVLPIASRPAAGLGRRRRRWRSASRSTRRLRGLLAALGHGLTATSANRSGGEPILDPARRRGWRLVAGEDAVVVDGGVLPGGPPSTLVAIEGEGLVVLRAGRFPVERLCETLRPIVDGREVE